MLINLRELKNFASIAGTGTTASKLGLDVVRIEDGVAYASDMYQMGRLRLERDGDGAHFVDIDDGVYSAPELKHGNIVPAPEGMSRHYRTILEARLHPDDAVSVEHGVIDVHVIAAWARLKIGPMDLSFRANDSGSWLVASSVDERFEAVALTT